MAFPPEMPQLPPGMISIIDSQLAQMDKDIVMSATEVNKRLPWQVDPVGLRPVRRYLDERYGAPTPYLGLTTDPAERKKLQLWTFLTEYFPDAFLAVLDVSIKGNDQHNPGQPLHWSREKSTDQMNTAMRHMWDDARGTSKDTDGAWHLAKAIWRLSAKLQLKIEAERNGVK